MHTSGIRRRSDLDKDTGTPNVVDEHPLIRCSPTILGGHAHLKRNEVTVERVLEALLRERRAGPLPIDRTQAITDEEVRAAIRYLIAVFMDLSKLYAELERRRALVLKTGRK